MQIRWVRCLGAVVCLGAVGVGVAHLKYGMPLSREALPWLTDRELPFGLKFPALRASPAEAFVRAVRDYREGRVDQACATWRELLEKRRTELSASQIAMVERRLATAATARQLTKVDVGDLLARASTLCGTPTASGSPEQIREAARLLDKAAATGSSEPGYDYLWAFCLLSSGRDAEAKPFLERAVAKAPDDPRALNLKALFCRRTGDQAGELASLRRSLELDPSQPDVHYVYCKLLLAQGKPEDRAAALASALASLGDDAARADELAPLFDEREAREQVERAAIECRIRAKRAQWAREASARRDGRVRSIFIDLGRTTGARLSTSGGSTGGPAPVSGGARPRTYLPPSSSGGS